jgi:GT2 family glycosyltransferase
MAEIDISIVAATYNRADLLQESLESLTRQETGEEFSYEVVVVDNASTDSTRTTVDGISDGAVVPVRYRYEGIAGIARARNRGIAESTGMWVAFFDDDQIADPAWLRELFAIARTTDASCIGGRVLLSSIGGTPLRSPVCRAILGETFHGDLPGPLPRKSLPGTGNVLIKRSVFDSIGMFDESFSRGCEDADFFRRVRRAGMRIWYAPKAIVFHIIPPHRFERTYLLSSFIRQGCNYAFLDYKEGGICKVTFSCVARIGQSLLVHLPAIILGHLQGDRDAVLGRECLLSKAIGYSRGALHRLFPRMFPQEDFISGLDYRLERKLAKARFPVDEL